MYKPKWYRDGQILVINAETCGINKNGHEQYIVNPSTGIRSETEIQDDLAIACEEVLLDISTEDENVFYHPSNLALDQDIFVPKYYDRKPNLDILSFEKANRDFELKSIGALIDGGEVEFEIGHGSPSSDQRTGQVPYIKVSDLRAGLVNINPSNMIPVPLAEKFWRSTESGLKPYDLISPMRASKNIGEFCILMPGQEQVVLTKEVMILRATEKSSISQFYLMWALSLKAVQKQWERIIFMQTNREDVGKRVLEILLPFPKKEKVMKKVEKPFKKYYVTMEENRAEFVNSISNSPFDFHIHLSA